MNESKVMLLQPARIVIALVIVAASSHAQAISYNIDWIGSGGYTMSGTFSFHDSLIGTGVIDSSSLSDFQIEGFLTGVSVGAFDLFVDTPLVGADIFNFNFDTSSEQFLVGGGSLTPTGQEWAAVAGGGLCETTGFGFASGNGSQGLCVAGTDFVGSIPIAQSTLTATRASNIPTPSTIALFAAGVGVFFKLRTRMAPV